MQVNVTNITEQLPVETAALEVEPPLQPQVSQAEKVNRATFKKGKQGGFLHQWCRDFPWLQFNSTTELASCDVCSRNAKLAAEKWAIGISGPYKKETFSWHAKSKMHCDSIVYDRVAHNPEQSELAKCVKNIEKSMFEHLTHLFHIAYFIGRHEKPFTDFPRQVILARRLNVNMKEQYTSDKACQSFIEFIALDLLESVIAKVKLSPNFSVLIDGSTDRSGDDNADVYVRYLHEGEIREDLLGLVTLESGTSEAYYTALTTFLDTTTIDWRRPNYLVSLGTDGAASMVGHKSGLVTLLKRDVPNCISVHCVAHRLQLAILDATGKIDYLSEFDRTVKKVFHFYRGSNKRLQSLRKTASVLEVEIVKLRDIHSIRWVSSKSDAMTALKKNFVAVIVNLESVASDTKTSGSGSSEAKGIVKNMQTLKFAKTLFFLIDLYSILDPLCKLLQAKELVLSQVKNRINVVIDLLEGLMDNEGREVKWFMTKQKLIGNNVTFEGLTLTHATLGERQYQLLRNTVIENTCRYLRERLDSTNNVVGINSNILDPMQYPSADSESFKTYGNKEVEVLARHFNLVNNNVDTLIAQWMELKYTTHSLGLSIQNILKRLKENPTRYEVLRPVYEAVACVAVSTASCERGFSYVNRIKTKQRLSLSTETLRDLLQLAVNGPPPEMYDPSAAIDKWYFSAPGKRHVNGHKRKWAVADL